MQSPHKRSFAAEELQRRRSKKPELWMVLGTTAIIVVISGYFLVIHFKALETEQAKAGIESVAILPFENLGADTDQQYFTDGMHEAVISALQKINALRVISRTSVMKFRDSARTVPEIARELGVDAVIEGSVLRADGRVRINVQLIAAEPERHLWSNDYTRDLTDIIALQNEVAQAIADEIRVTVTSVERARLSAAPKVNPEAYDYLLRGFDCLNRGGYGENNLRSAQQMFERAVVLDPSFAQAHAYLAISHGYLYWFGYERTGKCLDDLQKSVDAALKIDHDLPEAHFAQDLYHFMLIDYDRAIRYFAIAQRIIPHNPMLLMNMGCAYRWLGEFDEALEYFRQAHSVDPINHVYLFKTGFTLQCIGRFDEAEQVYNRAAELSTDDPITLLAMVSLYIFRDGDIEKTRKTLHETKADSEEMTGAFTGMCTYPVEAFEGRYDEALKLISTLSLEAFATPGAYYPKALVSALLYGLTGDRQRARDSFETARVKLEALVKDYPDDALYHCSLALACAGLGRRNDALRETVLGKHPFGSIVGGAWVKFNRARVFMLLGEHDHAVEMLEHVMEKPGYITIPFIRIHPDFKQLHNNPRFQKLIAGENRQ